MSKNKFFLGIAILFVLLIFLAIRFLFFSGDRPDSFFVPFLRIGETEIPVEIAGSGEERQKGLSGRDFLEPGSGMLFVFSEPGNYSFWMPDMRFPIDIVWIADGKVVGIEGNVSNKFDLQNPRFYAPPQPVRYVLEVNAGFAETNNIGVGDNVIFNGIPSFLNE